MVFHIYPKTAKLQGNTLIVKKLALLIIVIGIFIAVLMVRVYPKNDCMRIEGATYRSPKEVDNFFGGTMHPQISFSSGRFTSTFSDTVTVGTYECKSGKIFATITYNSEPVAVQFDPRTGNLLWDGAVYTR